MSAARPSRRRFLSAAGVLGLGTLGCGRRADPQPTGGDFRGQTLRIFVYAGGHERTMREAFVPAFERRTGARAVLDPGWWGSTAKLKLAPAGKPPFDLMVSDATEGYSAIREGLFQQIDFRRVPNVANLAPAVLDNWVYRDGYGITYPGSVMTLAYHREATPFTPTRWDDLLRPEVRGRVALYSSFYMSLYTFACMKAARDDQPGSAAALVEHDLDGVLAFARAHRDQVRIWWPTSSDMANHLVQKNCALGNMHSPEMLQLLSERSELGAVAPSADRAFVQSMWLIPAGTPRRELAEAALDLLFSEEMQLAFARDGSPTAVVPAAAARAREDELWRQLHPSTEEQLRAVRYYPYDAYFRAWEQINAVWDREVLRKS
jgi:spermidine/putrescine-binding protein